MWDAVDAGGCMSAETSVRAWGDLSARERDALIAEHVMGYRFWLEQRGEYTLAVCVPAGAREPWMGSRDWALRADRYVETTAADAVAKGFFGDGPPRFTTDIAAAFRVVEKARHGRCVQITSRADGWHVAIYPLDGSLDPASASGPLPEAICHAAVRACGVDV
jgi:hypothetical protein